MMINKEENTNITNDQMVPARSDAIKWRNVWTGIMKIQLPAKDVESALVYLKGRKDCTSAWQDELEEGVVYCEVETGKKMKCYQSNILAHAQMLVTDLHSITKIVTSIELTNKMKRVMSSLPEIGVVLPTDENLREIFKSFFQLRLWNLFNDGRKGYVLFTENFMAEYLHVNPKKCGTYTREITERCKSTTREDYVFTAQLRDVIGKKTYMGEPIVNLFKENPREHYAWLLKKARCYM
ncbi:ORF62-1 [Ostreid herpesvirus 1]|nr:ORF62-1 [Ostreid herpesvirus 1]